MSEIIVLLTVLIYLITVKIVYSFLEKRGFIPVKYHPYTNKKSQEYFWEFTRIYFLLTCAISVLFSGFFKTSIALLIITVLQVLAAIVINKHEWKLEEESLKIEFDEKDELEYKEYISELNVNKKKTVILPKRIVLYNNLLYFSKRRKILIKERMYKYIFMSSIEKREKILIIKYGFLGTPMFRIVMFIPKRKEKEVLNLLRKIEHDRKTLTFTRKYFDVFKKQ